MNKDLRVDHVLTSGTFSPDGGAWDVDNSVWVFGDDREVIAIDAAHEARPITDAVDGRKVKVIVYTHVHNDHITVAPELQEKFDTSLPVHSGDQMLWEQSWPDLAHEDLAHGQRLEIVGTKVVIINTPGHSPGPCCLYVPEAVGLFPGDMLFSGGPGVTGWSYSDFDTIINSIRDNLLILPTETTVRMGHGDHMTVGREAPRLEERVRRGY